MAGALQQLWLYRDHLTDGQRWLEQTLAAAAASVEPTDPSMPLPASRFGAFGAHPRVIALNSLSVLRLNQDKAEEAAIPGAEVLALARVVQDRVGEAHALIQLGNVARRLGNMKRAGTLHEEALSLARSLDDAFLAWRSLHQVGKTLSMLGDYDRARQHLEEGLAVARSNDNIWETAASLGQLGWLAFHEGKLDRAAVLIGESLRFLASIGDVRVTRQALWYLGLIALADEDAREAGARFCDSLKLSLKAPAPREIARCVDGLVAAAMKMDPPGPRSTRAAWLLGASATMRETYGPATRPDEQPLLDQAVTATRASLGEQVYDAAQTEGRLLSFHRAIELALALAAEIQ